MIVGKVLCAGKIEVNGEDLVGVFVECCRDDLRDCAGNLVYRMVEIRPMVAPANTAQQATDRKYGGGHVAPCGHYVNNGETCHVCYAAAVG